MECCPNLRRWLALGITIVVFGGIAIGVLIFRPGLKQPGEVNAADDMAKVWPLFGGTPSRNMVNTFEKNVPTEWTVEKKDDDDKVVQQAKNIKWVSRLGSRAYGGPVVAGGKVFVGTNNEAPRNPKVKGDKGILMCFNEADGKFLWQAIHDKLPSGQVNDWPREGICSTPVVEGNRVYYVSNQCDVVCADVEGFLDGKNDGVQDEQYKDKTDADIIWRLDMMKDLNVFPHNLAVCSPVIVDDLIFIVTANGVDEGHINLPSPDAPSFIAVEKKTGKLAWKNSAPGKEIMHGQWSNPVFAVVDGKPQVVFPGGDGWLRSFEPKTGKEIWRFDANPKATKYELGGRGTKNDFISTPVVFDNRLFIGVGQDPEHYEGVGHMWCIDMTKKGDVSAELVADAKANPPKGKPNDNSAAVWHFGGPVPQNMVNQVGRDYYFGRTMSTCSIHDGLVYIAELAGYLHCLDAKTGKKYWEHDLKAGIWGSTYWVDGKVFLGNEDGDIFIFAHGKEKKLIGKIEMEEPVKSTPVAVNGVLYIMTERNLYAVKK